MNEIIYTAPYVTVIHGLKKCFISRPKLGTVNIITNFNPIEQPVFIASLNDAPSIEYVRSLQRYSEKEGGVNIQLKPSCNQDELKRDIKSCLNELIDE